MSGRARPAWAAAGRPPKRKAAKKKAQAQDARSMAMPTEYNMLLTATLCLLAFGAVMVFSASSTTKVLSDGGLGESAYYLKRTLIVGAVGLVVMHFVARHGLESIRRLTPVFLVVSFFLLVVVLGAGQLGQRLEPLDRRRLLPDPALGAGQGRARPLRRRPARPTSRSGCAVDRGADAVPAGRRLGLAADRGRARHGHRRWSSPSPPGRC